MNTSPHLDQLSPSLLTSAKNVRKDLDLTKSFLASIKTNGVLQPIVAFPDPLIDGKYRIHMGHRRAAAAVEAGLETVPVYVITEHGAAEHLAEQLSENIHRSSLSVADTISGYQEMALFGMSAVTIAKHTSTKLADVGDALKVSKSAAAVEVLANHQLTLDQATAIVEFEDDPDALVALGNAADRGEGFTHTIQRYRSKRLEAAASEEAAAEIRLSGDRLVDRPDSEDKTTKRISGLYAKAGTYNVIRPSEHLDCPGRAMYASTRFDYSDSTFKPEVVEVCVDFKVNGHFDSSSSVGPLSDKEKAERKRARESTKEWVISTAVRLAWLQELVQRKTPPAGWELLTATQLLDIGATGSTPTVWKAVLAILALEHDSASFSYRDEVRAYLVAHPNRAPQVAVAIALGFVEGGFDFDRKGWGQSKAAPYLNRLQGWGFELSALEQGIVDAAKAIAA